MSQDLWTLDSEWLGVMLESSGQGRRAWEAICFKFCCWVGRSQRQTPEQRFSKSA